MTTYPDIAIDDVPVTTIEQRAQMASPNRNIALVLVGAVLALLVVYGGA